MTRNDQDQDLVGGDIVALLHERNELIRHAFANVVAADGPVKATLFDELVTILAGREAVAQELTHSFVERRGPVTAAVHTGPAERVEAISGLSLVSTMDAGDDKFDVELRGVARRVTLYLDAQECVDLPLLRRSLPAQELHLLAELLLSAEAIIRAREAAIKTEMASPDALWPRGSFAGLGDTILGASRPSPAGARQEPSRTPN